VVIVATLTTRCKGIIWDEFSGLGKGHVAPQKPNEAVEKLLEGSSISFFGGLPTPPN
jgi:hypothetical protein